MDLEESEHPGVKKEKKELCITQVANDVVAVTVKSEDVDGESSDFPQYHHHSNKKHCLRPEPARSGHLISGM